MYINLDYPQKPYVEQKKHFFPEKYLQYVIPFI